MVVIFGSIHSGIFSTHFGTIYPNPVSSSSLGKQNEKPFENI